MLTISDVVAEPSNKSRVREVPVAVEVAEPPPNKFKKPSQSIVVVFSSLFTISYLGPTTSLNISLRCARSSRTSSERLS